MDSEQSDPLEVESRAGQTSFYRSLGSFGGRFRRPVWLKGSTAVNTQPKIKCSLMKVAALFRVGFEELEINSVPFYLKER